MVKNFLKGTVQFLKALLATLVLILAVTAVALMLVPKMTYGQQEVLYNIVSVFTNPIDLDSEFMALPISAQEIIEEDGYEFIVSDNNNLCYEVGDEFDGDSIVNGYITYSEKTITLSHNGDEARDAYIHEVGHAVDAHYGTEYEKETGTHIQLISNTEEFQKIFKEEGSLGTKYGSTSSAEFFAETYDLLVRGEPIAATPKANEFVSQYL